MVMRLATVVALLVVSASAIAEPVSSSDMLVVVLQKQNGTRETHSQSIAAESCSLMLKLFKEMNEKGQSLTLNLGAPTQLMLKLLKELNEKPSLTLNLGPQLTALPKRWTFIALTRMAKLSTGMAPR